MPSGSVVQPPGCANELLVERGSTKGKKDPLYFCTSVDHFWSPTTLYAQASATDARVNVMLAKM